MNGYPSHADAQAQQTQPLTGLLAQCAIDFKYKAYVEMEPYTDYVSKLRVRRVV